MKFLAIILTSVMMFTFGKVENQTITATVVNATSDEGKISFALYNKSTFMQTPIQAKSTKIKEGKGTVVFENIAPGEYAIVCFHDKNDNDTMDFSENGMPLEDYGVSNNVMSFGPPNYEDAKFEVSNEKVTLEIKF